MGQKSLLTSVIEQVMQAVVKLKAYIPKKGPEWTNMFWRF